MGYALVRVAVLQRELAERERKPSTGMWGSLSWMTVRVSSCSASYGGLA